MAKGSMTAQEFVAKWRRVALTERAASHSHFNDLCRLVGHPTPAEADPKGERFAFEARVDKLGGGAGFADVWLDGVFAWEYKGPHADLDKAYQQLVQYKDALRNPPLLIVSDTQTIIIRTNYTNTAQQVIELSLDDLLDGSKLDLLRAAFFEPERLKPTQTTVQVTQAAASQFSQLADTLRRYGGDPEVTAQFVIRLLFCLFAEDISLLPKGVFKPMVQAKYNRSAQLTVRLQQLFAAMSTGGIFGMHDIRHFDGGLFEGDLALDLPTDKHHILQSVSRLDWSAIEPSVLGTHYTSREDTLLIVEPVLMAPLPSWRRSCAPLPGSSPPSRCWTRPAGRMS